MPSRAALAALELDQRRRSCSRGNEGSRAGAQALHVLRDELERAAGAMRLGGQSAFLDPISTSVLSETVSRWRGGPVGTFDALRRALEELVSLLQPPAFDQLTNEEIGSLRDFSSSSPCARGSCSALHGAGDACERGTLARSAWDRVARSPLASAVTASAARGGPGVHDLLEDARVVLRITDSASHGACAPDFAHPRKRGPATQGLFMNDYSVLGTVVERCCLMPSTNRLRTCSRNRLGSIPYSTVEMSLPGIVRKSGPGQVKRLDSETTTHDRSESKPSLRLVSNGTSMASTSELGWLCVIGSTATSCRPAGPPSTKTTAQGLSLDPSSRPCSHSRFQR